jgi:hypothetical protein
MAGREKLARLVLQADEAAVVVGDPVTGDVAGAAWTTIDAQPAGEPAATPPAADAGPSPQSAGTPGT